MRYNIINSIFHFNNISIGNNVYIGPGAIFLTSDANIIIGNNVLFGPKVTVVTGDHITDICGKMIFENKDKSSGKYDKDVVIEDDVWVGCNVTVLKGVRVGRGAVLAAGSIVNKDVLPYTIVGGVPAKYLTNRFSFEDAVTHEQIIYGTDSLDILELEHLK